jgi:hypothetical protein
MVEMVHVRVGGISVSRKHESSWEKLQVLKRIMLDELALYMWRIVQIKCLDD